MYRRPLPLVSILSLFPIAVSCLPLVADLSSSSTSTPFSACLAVGLSLLFLVLAKFGYMRFRRLHRGALNLSTSSLRSSRRSSSSFFYKAEHLPKPGKAAFLVGFFGSPSWETGTKSFDDAQPYGQFQSRRSQTINRRISKISITEFGGYRHSGRCTDTTAFSNTLVAPNSRSPPSYASLPAYPADVRLNSFSRRRSLPVGDHRPKRSSLKSSIYYRSNSLPNSTSSANIAPSKMQASFLHIQSPLPLPTSRNRRSRSQSHDSSSVPPLPPLPLSVLLSPIPDDLLHTKGRSFISYPYALSPRINRDLPDNTSSNDLVDSEDTLSRCPGSATLLQIKPNASHRSPSVRSRKSPPIGPSPLRIMTFPEGSLERIAQNSLKWHEEGSCVLSTELQEPPQMKTLKYADLGMGYPSSWSTASDSLDGGSYLLSSTVRGPPPRTISSAGAEAEDANAMLDIIQELVDETSRWDDSLFVDESFKLLIENSRSTSSSSSKVSNQSHQSSVLAEAVYDKSESHSTSPARSKPVSNNSAGNQASRSPKSILKSPKVSVETPVWSSDARKMSTPDTSPVLYDMPGAYEHGLSLTPLPESNEESEELHIAPRESHVGLAW